MTTAVQLQCSISLIANLDIPLDTEAQRMGKASTMRSSVQMNLQIHVHVSDRGDHVCTEKMSEYSNARKHQINYP